MPLKKIHKKTTTVSTFPLWWISWIAWLQNNIECFVCCCILQIKRGSNKAIINTSEKIHSGIQQTSQYRMRTVHWSFIAAVCSPSSELARYNEGKLCRAWGPCCVQRCQSYPKYFLMEIKVIFPSLWGKSPVFFYCWLEETCNDQVVVVGVH